MHLPSLALAALTSFPSPAVDADSARLPRSEEHSTSWLLCFGLGPEFARPSAEADLLELDGYSLGARTALSTSFAVFPSEFVGISGYLGYAFRSSAPSATSPTFSEHVGHFGGEVPFLFRPAPRWIVTLGPRFGLATGTLSVAHDGKNVSALEYGAGASALFRVSEDPRAVGGYIGVAAAYMLAPTAPIGDVGREHDFGGLMLSVSGALDD